MRIAKMIFGLLILFSLYSCNNPNDSSDECSEPSKSPCVGTSGNCMDYRIFNNDGEFIDNAKSTSGFFTWDGRDCNGKKVDCGAYTIRTAMYVNGSFISQQVSTTLIVDSSTPTATGETDCAPLEDTCSGEYIEYEATEWDPNTGTIISTLGCVCCE